jgi:outer membrane receptor protein involved in Fe transport
VSKFLRGGAGEEERRGIRGARALILLATLAVAGAFGSARAGTTGRLTGRVLDPAKKPIEAANIAIPSVRLGALSDAQGRYGITNIPSGTYEVRVSLLGYRATVIQNVHIAPDISTSLDITLSEAPVEMKEEVIKATRPVIDPNLTSNLATVNREEIQKLPVQELQDLVALQAGVVSEGGELHFRGGRAGEVQYQVDGISVNNGYDNKSSLRLDRSLLEEVQVITGTFDAEYGQAMSGVVNAVLRRGGDRFQWDAEVMGGAWVAPGADERLFPPQARLGDSQNYQITLSGPLGVPRTSYLFNVRRGVNDDWLRSQRFYTIDKDPSGTGLKFFKPNGDFQRGAMGYTREWSSVIKLNNRSISKLDLGYQAVGNVVEGRRTDWIWALEPDGVSKQHTRSLAHGVDATYTPNLTSFFNLIARQDFFDYKDMVFEDFNDPRYDLAGGPVVPSFIPDGPVISGVQLNRFTQRTITYQLKSSYVNESVRHHHMKFGGEFQWPEIRFGHPGVLTYTTQGTAGQVLVRQDEVLPGSPAVRTYWPILGAAFGQDEMEFEGLRLRGGARVDYFDARSALPSNLANPANAIRGSVPSVPVPTTPKVTLSPRIGVSYPVTPWTSIYFAYGHFSQMPPLRDIFQNADYSVLSDLQSGISYDVMGNPDVKPERTTQYQFGAKHAVNQNLGVDVNAFYKDIRDLLGVEFIETDNAAEYTRITNVDFGSVIGMTLALDQRALGIFSIATDYTWQIAEGNSSDPRETATRAQNGLDSRPRQIPLNWDQRHTLNVTVTAARPERFLLSSVLRVASGQPYTPSTGLGGFGFGLEANSGRKPPSWLLDLRGEVPVRLGSSRFTAYARMFNVFDTRFFNGFVFASSGQVDHSSAVEDQAALKDPTRFYPPRRLEIGFTMRGGS